MEAAHSDLPVSARLTGERREAAGWSLEDVRVLLTAYGRNPRALAVTELPGGWENLNLLITADSERLVMRRYDVTPPEEVPWELALLRFLTDKGFPTAGLIERPNGQPAGTFTAKPAALFSFVAGQHPAWDAPGIAAQTAEFVARLHAVTSGLTLPYPRSRMDSRRRLDSFREWLREQGSTSNETALSLLAEQVNQHLTAFATRLAPGEAVLPKGVVHHDAHAGNLLCDEPGRLVALLDFDDAHETYLLADVAVLIDIWGTDQPTHTFRLARAAEVLQAYTRCRPLGSEEWELLPDFLILYNLADTVSYVSSRVQRGMPAAEALANCGQYAKYLRHTAVPDWRDRLRAALQSCP